MGRAWQGGHGGQVSIFFIGTELKQKASALSVQEGLAGTVRDEIQKCKQEMRTPQQRPRAGTLLLED